MFSFKKIELLREWNEGGIVASDYEEGNAIRLGFLPYPFVPWKRIEVMRT